MSFRVAVAVSLLAVAGCSGLSHEPPASLAQTAGGGPPEQQPQSSNSLPPGSQVNAPFTTNTGAVGTVRVGPASGPAPASSVKEPQAGTATGTVTGVPRRMQNSY